MAWMKAGAGTWWCVSAALSCWTAGCIKLQCQLQALCKWVDIGRHSLGPASGTLAAVSRTWTLTMTCLPIHPAFQPGRLAAFTSFWCPPLLERPWHSYYFICYRGRQPQLVAALMLFSHFAEASPQALTYFGTLDQAEEQYKFAFRLYDVDGDGFVGGTDLYNTLSALSGRSHSDAQWSKQQDRLRRIFH
ncbi:hypothetical protein V8C86DRAFT_3027969 [Haematococcus lacustris]